MQKTTTVDRTPTATTACGVRHGRTTRLAQAVSRKPPIEHLSWYCFARRSMQRFSRATKPKSRANKCDVENQKPCGTGCTRVHRSIPGTYTTSMILVHCAWYDTAVCCTRIHSCAVSFLAADIVDRPMRAQACARFAPRHILD